MTTILVTGGAGYVGSHCCKALREAGFTPVVYDNLSTGHRDFVRWGPLVEGDVRDAARLQAVMREHRPLAVMHFAALALVGESMREPSMYYDVNVVGTLRILEAMRACGIGKIVFSSTCAVYGEPEAMPIRESMAKAPVNPYGASKLAAERMMDDFSAAYGLRSVRLRYFNAAGADPEAEVGEHHENETHLIPIVLDVALGHRPCISIFGNDFDTPDGTAVRDYIHVCDLADAHTKALGYLITGGETLAVNLGTGSGASVIEVIDAAEAIVARRMARVEAPRRPGDPPSLVADPHEALRVLSWRARRSDLETIIGDAWTWHCRRFGGEERGDTAAAGKLAGRISS